jgi:hypothetical protein
MVVSRQWSGVDEASIRLWIYGWSVSEGGSDVVTFCGIFELFFFFKSISCHGEEKLKKQEYNLTLDWNSFFNLLEG